MGRPTKYTKELAEVICFRIMEGESLKHITDGKDMPTRSTVHLWIANNVDFSDKYKEAKENQADTLADELLYLADNATDVHKARLQIDTRKWVAAKLKPKKYGEKLELSGDKENPLTINVVDYRDATDNTTL